MGPHHTATAATAAAIASNTSKMGMSLASTRNVIGMIPPHMPLLLQVAVLAHRLSIPPSMIYLHPWQLHI